MRLRFNQIRSLEDLSLWWYEFPVRRHPIRTISTLLFEPGRGWLRWSGDLTEFPSYDYYEPPEQGYVFPPARRLWFRLYGDTYDYSDPDWPEHYL